MDFPGMFFYLAVTSITPGPNNLTCLYLGASRGFWRSRRFLIGSTLSVLVKALLCGLLNVALATAVPAVVPYLKWVGAAYMVYLAFRMGCAGFQKEETQSGKMGEATYLSGILLQCLNMKSWIAALSVFSVYVTPYTTAPGAIVGTAVCFFLGIVISSILWCLFGQLIQKVYVRWKMPLSLLMAASLIFCAVTAVL